MAIVIISVIALVGFAIAGVAVTEFRERRKIRVKGIKLLQALRMLIKHLQMHRGLSAAASGGSDDVYDSLLFHADSIKADISMIVAIDNVFADDENWQGITQHWARLSSRSERLGVFDTYEQHCRLVSACLMLMRSVEDNYRITPRLSHHNRTYWYELLSLGEGLGQVRALGFVALTLSNNLQLREQCRRKVSEVLTNIEAIYRNYVLQDRIGKGKSDEIYNFIALVEHYVVNEKSWITGEQYFSKATETLEIIYQQFDEEMQALLNV